MFRIAIFSVLFFFSVTVSSQQITGKVVDFQTHTPLPGVTVLLASSSASTQTDASGLFILSVPDGEQVLIFKLEGYLEKQLKVEVDSLGLDLPKVSLELDLVAEAEQQLVVISESELEDDESSADMVSGLLQSSQDVFMRRAAFDFGSVFFKPRGYDSKDATVLINGLPMNRIENGRAQWSDWGGLNDVIRNQELSIGLTKSDYTFGGVFGSNYINIRPTLNRPGIRLSASASNRSYTGRVMATYNSGKTSNGLAYTLSASRRWATNGGYVDGTLYNAYSVFGALEYELNRHNSLNLIAIYTPNRRGKSSPLTKEVIDLVGYRYNPWWGNQNGDKRNSRNKIVNEPIFILSYNYDKENTRIDANIGYQFGEIGNTRISYANAQNPEPNYYRMLPSFYINQEPSDVATAQQQAQYFLANRQLDWASLYRANINSTNGRSVFIISNDINQERTISANINFSTSLYQNLKLTAGIVYRNIESDNYAEIDDLLGGKYFNNYDYFAQVPYNNLEINTQKYKGDKWMYHYGLKSNVSEAFAQLEFDFDRLEFFVAGRYHYTDYQREGKYNYSLFADSYGVGEKQIFNGLSTKAGLTYAITGRHILQWHVGYFNTPQSVRNTFTNIRNSNKLVPNLNNETSYTTDASYILRMPYFKSRFTTYYTQIQNTYETNFFYTEVQLTDEVSNEFVAQTITGIKKQHFGIEWGAEAQILPTIKLTAAVAIGQHTYINNPSLFVSSGEIGTIEIDKVMLKNYRVPSGPQQAYSIGIEYRNPKYWWVGVTGNLLSRNYISISAINRTSRFFINPDTGSLFTNIDQNLARKLLSQERLNDVFLLNLMGGKSWRIKGKYVSLFASINNFLNEKFVSGGFEQSRTANYERMLQDNANGNPSFGPRYFLGMGTTYFINLAVSL